MASSEKSYINNLELCVNAMYQPVKDKVAALSNKRLARRKEKFATHEEVETIFSTIGKLVQLHKGFLAKIEARVAVWNRDSVIADLFLTEVY